MTELEQWKAEARAMGVEAGKAAASWVVDGNTSAEHVRRVVDMIDDGDPAADDYFPTRPDLSGEWSDDLTPIGLYEQVTGRDHVDEAEQAALAYETLVGSLIDALCAAWEEGVGETFEVECERLLRSEIAGHYVDEEAEA